MTSFPLLRRGEEAKSKGLVKGVNLGVQKVKTDKMQVLKYTFRNLICQ